MKHCYVLHVLFETCFKTNIVLNYSCNIYLMKMSCAEARSGACQFRMQSRQSSAILRLFGTRVVR